MDHLSRLQQLSFREGVAAICVSAVAVHGIFKRYEPSGIFTHVLLIFLLPDVLTVFLYGHLGLLNAWAVSHLIYWSTLASSVLAYRLSPFHPLARYPGPTLMKMSKWWGAKINLDGYQHRHIQDLHKQHGNVVRIGPNELSIRDVSAIEHVYGLNGLPKGPMWIGRTLGSPFISLIAEREHGPHAMRRKPWNRGLSMAAIRDYEEIITKRAMQLAEHLDGLAPSEVVLSHWLGSFSFDIMADMAFGGGFEMMRDGDTTGLLGLLERGIVVSSLLGQVPYIGKYVGTLFSNGATKLRAMGRDSALARIKRGSLTRDIFYYLNNEDGAEASPPPLTQIIPDGTLVIVAGSDTTSSTLTCLFSGLMRHPDTYKRLQAEVDQFYPFGENACDPKYHLEMPYLNAVINEALRLYPAVPGGSQRSTATVPGGKVVGSIFIPEGTQVSVHIYSLHRDPNNFSPHPESFWPERWLLAAGDSTVKLPPGATFTHNAGAFIPFSYGPMNCVGRPLALLEMRMAVCMLMQRFTMRLPANYDADAFDYELKDMLVWRLPKLPAIVERRREVRA